MWFYYPSIDSRGRKGIPGWVVPSTSRCYDQCMKPTRVNIRKVMDLATDADRAEGLAWYGEAYEYASTLTPGNPAMGAGILAALSPNTSWPQNKVRALTLVTTGEVRHFPDAVGKAKRILAGEEPLSVLGGPKVRSFYTDIMDLPNDVVTIDRHAIDIAMGKPLKNAERAPWQKGRNYASIARMYVDVAREYDVTPNQLQAITWVWWRKNKAVANHG